MTHVMNCAAFDDRLADYLEGDLGTAELEAIRVHVASCVRCTALVRDLERIRAGAGELPELSPSRDLWAAIADRIEAPVVPIAPIAPIAVRATPNVARERRGDRLRLAAVAAALVAVTAGVTYTLTARRGATVGVETVVQSPIDSTSRDSAQPSVPVQRNLAGTDSTTPASEQPSSAPSAQAVRNTAPANTSSREIDRLRSVFVQNRSLLDPRTAAIIEANLKVIDEAIAQSKAALAQDPASKFLSNQLNNALDKKLELLRTAALLPNRT